MELLGDTNIDLLKHKQHGDTTRYLETLLDHGQLPLITLPTRVGHTSATLIDHISSSQQTDRYDTGILISSLSDHLPVFYIKHCDAPRPAPQYSTSRKINSTTIPKFESLLQSSNWDTVLNENRPEYAFSTFFTKMSNFVNTAFPETKKKISKKFTPQNPWMSQALMVSRKRKEKLFALKLRKPTNENIDKFKVYNKTYNKLKRTAKHSYYRDKFEEYSGNMKKTWETIREVLGTQKHREDIPDFFQTKGKIITGSSNIAEGFNDFFSGIGPELADKIEPSGVNFGDYLGDRVEDDFIFCRVTPDLVTEIAGKLKPKASFGQDNISTKLLKQILPSIINPVCHLLNLSLQTGYIPVELKTAKVVPVYKSDDKHSFTNYRPISLLSSLSKLMEKIVAKQMVGFLFKNKILYKHQYGFRQAYNTAHPVIHFLEHIFQALNKPTSEYTLGVFLDLKKGI